MHQLLYIPSSVCFSYLKEFCEETTLHGLIHLVAPKRHWLEKFLWFLALIVSVIGSCWIVTESWHRYVTNPVVISMVKEYHTWNVTLPTGTLCFNEKLDVTKAAAFIKRKWNVTAGDEKFDYYKSFVHTVANSGMHTLAPFGQFANDTSLADIDLLDTAINTAAMHNKQYQVLTLKTEIGWTVTEMGVCLSVMSPNSIAHVMNSKFFPNMENPKLDQMPYCKTTRHSCLGAVMNMDRTYMFYVHSPLEIPDATTKYFDGVLRHRLLLSLEEEHLYSSPDIRKLWQSQRRCYFPDENIYGHVPVYSTNFCRMQCRRNLIYQLCGCAPHFYNRIPGQRVCDAKGLTCVAKNVDYVMTETKLGQSKACKCYPTCEEIVYRPNDIQNGRFFGTVVNWIIINFTKSRYRRDIIFEFSDLLVSFGGTAALFLGCSLMIGVELVYFFTIRLSRFIGRKTVHLRQTFQTRSKQFWTRINHVR